MTRTITVTGGFSGSVVVDVADSLKTLEGATFRLALTSVGQDDPPPYDSPTWLAATATGLTAGAVTVSRVVDSATPTGYYNLALDIVEGGNHEVEWVTDRTNRRRRALVNVT